MKYKFIKKLESNFAVGDTFENTTGEYIFKDNYYIVSITDLIDKGYIKEIKEIIKPQFKVWDYINAKGHYWKIIWIQLMTKTSIEEYAYNISWLEVYELEENIKAPTDEELDIFFK